MRNHGAKKKIHFTLSIAYGAERDRAISVGLGVTRNRLITFQLIISNPVLPE